MKPLFLLAAVWSSGGVVLAQADAAFTVHEWGTFTTVSGSDGVLLPGLEREEHALPNFVHSHAGFSPANKGWDRPVRQVTVKMETPVIYFYAPQSLAVTVDVGFRGGSISQWYPERSGGETLPPAPTKPTAVWPIDFSAGYAGSAAWKLEVLPPKAHEPISAPRDQETPQWPRARVKNANKVRGPTGEVEGFVFYRGIGNFSLPLRVTATEESLVVSNSGTEEIPFVFVYEKRPELSQAVVGWSGALRGNEERKVRLGARSDGLAVQAVLERVFPEALQRAGLTAEEGAAMVATWRESYFERDGLRVFWIVPRALTDRVLPMTITPPPDRLERVLVGRSEILAPGFERELVREFAADGGKRWADDRYFLAYQTRARQLGVVLPGKRP